MIEDYRATSCTTPRPVALGVVGAAAGIDDHEVATIALYDDAATVSSAALKLLGLDPAEAARWVAELAPQIDAWHGRSSPTSGRSPSSHRRRRSASSSPPPSMPRAASASLQAERALRIGIGGPVGSGKSSLIAALCGELRDEHRIGVVTNDIYTTEDAQFLRASGALAPERIVAVQTGCCPHTAIRDDITTNLEAVEQLERDEGPLDLVLVESGGDNLTAVFSPALADVQIFVIDVAGGDDIPRKGGPGVARADLLVINKTDLAPFVGSDVGLMLSDATARRGDAAGARRLAAQPAARAGRGGVGAGPAQRVRGGRRAPALERPRSTGPSPQLTPTRTDAPAAVLEVGAGGAVVRLRRGARLAPRMLGRSAAGVVRAAFVPRRPGRWRATRTAPGSSSARARR